jgi:hypothetical protein
MIPLINGTSYEWVQIELRLFNRTVPGVTAIKYEETRDIVDNYGAGKYPVSRAYGKIETKASITLEMVEVEALQSAITTGSLMDIPEFDIVVSYLPEGGIICTHTLHNCRFKGNKREAKKGDTTIEVEIELAVSHLTWK